MAATATTPRSNDEAAPLGILAGGSGVPCEIAEAVTARGRSVHIVGLIGEAEPGIERFSHTWVNWGGVGAMIRAFRRHNCGEIVIVGRVRRPDLLAIRPDLGFWTSMPALLPFLRGGDDAVLRMVVGFFERRGLVVVGAHQAAPELIAPTGVLGRHRPTDTDWQAIRRCTMVLDALGPFDAAQAAAGRGETLLAVEGADGTDAMLRRLAEPRAKRPAPGGQHSSGTRAGTGVLVKLPKPQQERRIDLPAIGPETIIRATDAGLAGIAVLSGQTLVAERRRVVELADGAGLFVVGLPPAPPPRAEASSEAGDDLANGIQGLKQLAYKAPAGRQMEDAVLGARVLAALEVCWPSASVVVSRRYVLATEGPGGASAAAERAGRLKPWGARLLRRRTGVLVMTDIAGELGLDPRELIRSARASGLAGIAILRSPRDEAALAVLRSAADRDGLFLLAPGDAR